MSAATVPGGKDQGVQLPLALESVVAQIIFCGTTDRSRWYTGYSTQRSPVRRTRARNALWTEVPARCSLGASDILSRSSACGMGSDLCESSHAGVGRVVVDSERSGSQAARRCGCLAKSVVHGINWGSTFNSSWVAPVPYLRSHVAQHGIGCVPRIVHGWYSGV